VGDRPGTEPRPFLQLSASGANGVLYLNAAGGVSIGRMVRREEGEAQAGRSRSLGSLKNPGTHEGVTLQAFSFLRHLLERADLKSGQEPATMRNLATMKNLAWLTFAGVFAAGANAANVTYVNWHSTSGNQVFGSMTIGSQTVNVTYTGDFIGVQLNNTGTFYYTNASTYQSANIDNAPTTSDIIRLYGGNENVNTLTFDTPLLNVVMPIVSLGSDLPDQPHEIASFEFNKSFSIESFGPGYFGNGLLMQSGNTLIGVEGHGSILFSGSHTSISWTNPYPENWYGFTVGAMEAVPEPGTMAALGLGLAALGRRRRK
jgi:hypothetical protein